MKLLDKGLHVKELLQEHENVSSLVEGNLSNYGITNFTKVFKAIYTEASGKRFRTKCFPKDFFSHRLKYKNNFVDYDIPLGVLKKEFSPDKKPTDYSRINFYVNRPNRHYRFMNVTLAFRDDQKKEIVDILKKYKVIAFESGKQDNTNFARLIFPLRFRAKSVAKSLNSRSVYKTFYKHFPDLSKFIFLETRYKSLLTLNRDQSVAFYAFIKSLKRNDFYPVQDITFNVSPEAHDTIFNHFGKYMKRTLGRTHPFFVEAKQFKPVEYRALKRLLVVLHSHKYSSCYLKRGRGLYIATKTMEDQFGSNHKHYRKGLQLLLKYGLIQRSYRYIDDRELAICRNKDYWKGVTDRSIYRMHDRYQIVLSFEFAEYSKKYLMRYAYVDSFDTFFYKRENETFDLDKYQPFRFLYGRLAKEKDFDGCVDYFQSFSALFSESPTEMAKFLNRFLSDFKFLQYSGYQHMFVNKCYARLAGRFKNRVSPICLNEDLRVEDFKNSDHFVKYRIHYNRNLISRMYNELPGILFNTAFSARGTELFLENLADKTLNNTFCINSPEKFVESEHFKMLKDYHTLLLKGGYTLEFPESSELLKINTSEWNKLLRITEMFLNDCIDHCEFFKEFFIHSFYRVNIRSFTKAFNYYMPRLAPKVDILKNSIKIEGSLDARNFNFYGEGEQYSLSEEFKLSGASSIPIQYKTDINNDLTDILAYRPYFLNKKVNHPYMPFAYFINNVKWKFEKNNQLQHVYDLITQNEEKKLDKYIDKLSKRLDVNKKDVRKFDNHVNKLKKFYENEVLTFTTEMENKEINKVREMYLNTTNPDILDMLEDYDSIEEVPIRVNNPHDTYITMLQDLYEFEGVNIKRLIKVWHFINYEEPFLKDHLMPKGVSDFNKRFKIKRKSDNLVSLEEVCEIMEKEVSNFISKCYDAIGVELPTFERDVFNNRIQLSVPLSEGASINEVFEEYDESPKILNAFKSVFSLKLAKYMTRRKKGYEPFVDQRNSYSVKNEFKEFFKKFGGLSHFNGVFGQHALLSYICQSTDYDDKPFKKVQYNSVGKDSIHFENETISNICEFYTLSSNFNN